VKIPDEDKLERFSTGCLHKHASSTHLYTDASKTERSANGLAIVGCAVVMNDTVVVSKSLPSEMRVSAAEKEAIILALQHLLKNSEVKDNEYTIFSDRQPCLRVLYETGSYVATTSSSSTATELCWRLMQKIEEQ
jgi:ribonuclease HI